MASEESIQKDFNPASLGQPGANCRSEELRDALVAFERPARPMAAGNFASD